MLRTHWFLLFLLFLAATACAHAVSPPQALADGELAYVRAGNSADTLAVQLHAQAESYCARQHQLLRVDGRDDVPGSHQIEVQLKFHCQPAGAVAPAAPEEGDDQPEGVGPWAH